MLAQHSRLVDQAAALRCGAAAAQPRATSIAVISGKGGVGKTSMAVNLAVALSQRGVRVTLLDLDLGLANVDLLLDLHPTRNLGHVLSGTHRLEDIMIEGPAGVRVVPGASGLERLANLSEFQRHQLLQYFFELETACDFMVMDLGAGVARNVLAFAAAADLVLVVTTPEPTALADAYSTVKMLVHENPACDFDVLVNQAHSRREARLTYERLAGVAGRFLGVPLTSAGYVLFDDAVVLAVRARSPFVLASPSCNASACVQALAQRYAHCTRAARRRGGFFHRIARIFTE